MACGNEYTFSGSGTSGLNGLTFVQDQYGGYAAESYYMFQPGSGGNYYWRVALGGTVLYVSETFPNGTVCPDEAVWLVGSNGLATGTGAANAPTVVAGSGAPAQNTFGLPADVVALITSRFGTVANFLRLRNQGQV
jgi:hypothetical protein